MLLHLSPALREMKKRFKTSARPEQEQALQFPCSFPFGNVHFIKLAAAPAFVELTIPEDLRGRVFLGDKTNWEESGREER